MGSVPNMDYENGLQKGILVGKASRQPEIDELKAEIEGRADTEQNMAQTIYGDVETIEDLKNEITELKKKYDELVKICAQLHNRIFESCITICPDMAQDGTESCMLDNIDYSFTELKGKIEKIKQYSKLGNRRLSGFNSSFTAITRICSGQDVPPLPEETIKALEE
jgi:chromosome segregation ATPase